MINNLTLRQLLVLLLAMMVAGCSSIRSGSNAVKGEAVEPAADAGFIEHPERQTKRGPAAPEGLDQTRL